jgi:hypothetical protein
MFPWSRDKTKTAYNNIQDDQSSFVSNYRPQTAPTPTHQKQYPNGRLFYFL